MHGDFARLYAPVLMLDERHLAIAHVLGNDEGDLCGALGELSLFKRFADSGKLELGDAVELLTLDGDGLSNLHIVDGVGAADACQRHGDVTRCGQSGSRV